MKYIRIITTSRTALLSGFMAISVSILFAASPGHAQTQNIDQRIAAVKVAEAIGMARQGAYSQSAANSVKFTSDAVMPATEESIQAGNFRLASTMSGHLRSKEAMGQSLPIGGVLLHQDIFGRCISTRFDAAYTLGPDGSILVSDAVLAPVAPPRPSTNVYIVPAVKVTPAILKARPLVLLMDYVRKNSVSRLQTEKSDRLVKDYYVFAFVMDRLGPDAQIDLVASDTMSGFGGRNKRTNLISANGWHIAYMPVKTSLSCNPQIYFKVIYTPGIWTPPEERKSVLIGAYTTDSLVQQTQRLLAIRRYQPGPADGVMGKNTRQAIKAYQGDLGLRADGRLNPTLYSSFAVSGARRTQKTQPTRTVSNQAVENRLKRFETKMWPNSIRK